MKIMSIIAAVVAGVWGVLAMSQDSVTLALASVACAGLGGWFRARGAQ